MNTTATPRHGHHHEGENTMSTTTTEPLDYAGNPEHFAWCSRSDCYTEDGPDGYASHFGHEVPLSIDRNDVSEWRNAPEGAPELTVRPIELSGHIGVEISAGDLRTVQSTSGSIGVSWLTTTEARHLAKLLTIAAEQAEAGR